MVGRNIQNRARHQFSTKGVTTGSAKGTILKYNKRGRLYAVGEVDIGGTIQQICFEPELLLRPGNRISFTRRKDPKCLTGVKAANVKVV